MIETKTEVSAELLTEIRDDVHELKALLLGERGNLGLAAKVNIMWAWHVPVVATAGTIAGGFATYLATRFFS